MADLTNLQVTVVRKNLNRVDLDLAEVLCDVPLVDVDGAVTGGVLSFSIRVDDPRLTSNQRTTLKNVIKGIGQTVLSLA